MEEKNFEGIQIVRLKNIVQLDFEQGKKKRFYKNLLRCYNQEEGILFIENNKANFRVAGVEPLRFIVKDLVIEKEFVLLDTMKARYFFVKDYKKKK